MASIRKRENRDSTISYRVDVRLKGHPKQTATFTRLTDAKRWGQQTEAAIREGRHFKTTESRKHTLADLVDRYIKHVLPRKTDKKKQAAQLKWWKNQIGSYTLSDVTPALIAEYRDVLLSETTRLGGMRTPSTTNRYMAVLSHAFTVATNKWGWTESNPLRKVTRPKEPRGRVRYLSDDELQRLTAACQESDNPYLYPAFMLAVSTGARQAEIMKLTWNDIDLNRGQAILHETKNGERRAIPIKGKALEVLKDHAKIPRIDTPLLFPGKKIRDKPMDLRAPWIKALKAAEIEDFHWHDLRHTTASFLAMNGASLAEIAEILGHKTLQMVKRYSHLSESHIDSVVERMNKKMWGE